MLLFRYIFLLLIIINLASCGFQLRQSASLPQSMLSTYIQTSDHRSIFSRKLKQQLLSSKAKVEDVRTNATAILKVLEDETGKRVLSVSARNIATEYEIFYRIVFSLEENGMNSIEPRELILTRSYTFNEKLVLGKSQEEEVLTEALAENLVSMVLNQISLR